MPCWAALMELGPPQGTASQASEGGLACALGDLGGAVACMGLLRPFFFPLAPQCPIAPAMAPLPCSVPHLVQCALCAEAAPASDALSLSATRPPLPLTRPAGLLWMLAAHAIPSNQMCLHFPGRPW